MVNVIQGEIFNLYSFLKIKQIISENNSSESLKNWELAKFYFSKIFYLYSSCI